MHFFPSSFILLDLVSYHFPWSGRIKLSSSSSCLMKYFPSCNLLLLKLVLPYPTPSPLPGARRVKWLPRDMIYGKKECKSYQFTTFKCSLGSTSICGMKNSFEVYCIMWDSSGCVGIYAEWLSAILFCIL